jgi:hypothetical protein
MPPLDLQERLSAIAGELELAAGLLISPSAHNLDRSSLILEDAAAALAGIPPVLASQSPAEAWRLRDAVRHSSALLRHAAEFHQSWRGIRGAMCSGYQPGGGVSDPALPARMCMEG